jgi:predicted PurR-regulated permease PerM
MSPTLRFGLPVASLVFLWFFYREIPILFSSLMLSMGLFYLLNPFVDFLESRSIRRGVATSLTLLAMFIGLYVLWVRIAAVTADLKSRIDVNEFQKNMVNTLHRAAVWGEEQAPILKKWLEPPAPVEPVAEKKPSPSATKGRSATPKPAEPPPPPPPTLRERIDRYVGMTLEKEFIDVLVGLARRAPTVLFTAILTLYFTFFLLKDGHKFKKTIIEWIPNRYFEPSLKFFYEMNRRLRSYLVSMALDCLLIGLLVGLGSAAVGAPYPVVFGVVAGLCNTIPLLGPLLYGAICLFITIGSGESSAVILGFLGVFLISRLCDDFVLAPLIYGKSHHLHPIAIVTAVLLGEHFAGVWGMFLAVPIVSSLALALSIAEEITEGEDLPALPPSVFKPFA